MFLLVPAYPGCPGQKSLNGCVCVCVRGGLKIQVNAKSVCEVHSYQ